METYQASSPASCPCWVSSGRRRSWRAGRWPWPGHSAPGHPGHKPSSSALVHGAVWIQDLSWWHLPSSYLTNKQFIAKQVIIIQLNKGVNVFIIIFLDTCTIYLKRYFFNLKSIAKISNFDNLSFKVDKEHTWQTANKLPQQWGSSMEAIERLGLHKSGRCDYSQSYTSPVI